MKKTLVLVMAIITLSLFAYSQAKIGIINAQEVVQKTKRGINIQKRLEKLGQARKDQITKKQAELKTLEKELQSPALNTETREKKARSFQDKRVQLQRLVEDAQKYMQKETQKELLQLQKEIMPLIQALGKAQGYTLIIDMANSGVAYFDTKVDLTAEVIKAVDAKFPQ